MCDSAYIPTILAICLIAIIFYVFHKIFTKILSKTKLQFKNNIGLNTRFIPTASLTYLFTEIEIFGLCLTILYLGTQYLYSCFGGDLESEDCLLYIIANTWQEVSSHQSNSSLGFNIEDSSIYTYPIDVIFTGYKSFQQFFYKKQKKWIKKQVNIIPYQRSDIRV